MDNMKLPTFTLMVIVVLMNWGMSFASDLDELLKQYHEMKKHRFSIGDGDIVEGEKGVAIHQIVLITKNDCSACDDVVDALSQVVLKNDTAVYLIIKNNDDTVLKSGIDLDVSQFPAVFIDGKYSPLWDFPGFLDIFTNDCGC